MCFAGLIAIKLMYCFLMLQFNGRYTALDLLDVCQRAYYNLARYKASLALRARHFAHYSATSSVGRFASST